MLILTSDGITSEKLFKKTKELLNENMKSVALIPQLLTYEKTKS